MAQHYKFDVGRTLAYLVGENPYEFTGVPLPYKTEAQKAFARKVVDALNAYELNEEAFNAAARAPTAGR